MSWQRKPPVSTRLTLEQLEDRRVLSVTYHGGPLLTHVEVEPVYYGDYWNTAAGQQQGADLNGYLAFLTNSTYMDLLAEYRVGRGSLTDPGIAENGLTAGHTVSDSHLQAMLDADIAAGNLKPPDANRLYILFTPPDVTVTSSNGDSVHNFFGYHDSFTSSAGASVYYAVIAHPVGNGNFGNLNTFQTLTKVTSHELAEGVTDPDGGGWFDNQSGEEIGDLSNGREDIGVLNGYVIQAEWSARLRASVLPVGATGVDTLASNQTNAFPSVFTTVASAFSHSGEYFANLIRNDYQQFLERAPAAAEVDYWVQLMQQGVTDEQVLTGFVGSQEYYQHAGGTDQAWLGALYHDLLGRTPDARGEDAWLQALASGLSRSSIAHGFAVSGEREGLVVMRDYQQYLGRDPAAWEVAGWVSAFQHGTTNEQIVATFVGSQEFFDFQGGTVEGWLFGAYQTVLGRLPDKDGLNYWDAVLTVTLA